MSVVLSNFTIEIIAGGNAGKSVADQNQRKSFWDNLKITYPE